jgi:thiosulfate reductase cytochrome b subunit
VKRIPMYTFHERIWHWLQAFTVLILLGTGAEIHYPERYHVLGFHRAVAVHEAFALLLLINAFLGLFYFVTSGLIRHYVTAEREFTNLAARQVAYYLRGIFRGAAHPMEHDADNKLNPLQKVTYLVILNVLLPVQVASGVLIWGASRWADLVGRLGGTPMLVSIHTMASWLFLAFVIMHVYLTTTGDSPLSNTKAMIVGYITRDDGNIKPSARREEGTES